MGKTFYFPISPRGIVFSWLVSGSEEGAWENLRKEFPDLSHKSKKEFADAGFSMRTLKSFDVEKVQAFIVKEAQHRIQLINSYVDKMPEEDRLRLKKELNLIEFSVAMIKGAKDCSALVLWEAVLMKKIKLLANVCMYHAFCRLINL